jgi:outer membrane protein assembly factor BamB
MPTFRCLLAAVTLSTLLWTPASAQLRQNSLPSKEELARYGLVRAWWARAVIDPTQDKVRAIAADEQAVFVQSTSGIISAIDGETGRLMWARLVGSPNQVTFPLVTNDEMLFVAAGMDLYGIDKTSGEPIWSIKLPHHPSASPYVDEEHAYIGTVDGSVYAYDLARVKDLYQRRLLPQYQQLTLEWRYQAPSEIVSPPVSNGEVVVFASFSGLLFSVLAEDRGLNFQFETEGRAPIRVPVGRSEDTIYVASDDARVFALDMTNGNRRWSFTAGTPVRRQPRVVGSHVFVNPDGRGMYCLRTLTGFEEWRQPEAVRFLAATPDIVYVSDAVNNVLILDREDGSILATLPYRHLSARVQNERTDRLYLATEGGLVVCIREAAREMPLWHMFPERQPIRVPVAPDEPEGEGAPAAAENPFAAE